MESTTPKPPAQVAGVAGISATPITMNLPQIDWASIVALPPFQQFVAEKAAAPGGHDSLANALAYARQNGGGQELLDEYATWHSAKGYWPNETPFGLLKKGQYASV